LPAAPKPDIPELREPRPSEATSPDPAKFLRHCANQIRNVLRRGGGRRRGRRHRAAMALSAMLTEFALRKRADRRIDPDPLERIRRRALQAISATELRKGNGRCSTPA